MESSGTARDRARACAYCNKSKTKCTWAGEPGAGTCQRCERLGRPCTLPDNGPRRRRGPSRRVGQLEDKIDGIMSLLNASKQVQQTPPGSRPQQGPQPDAQSGTGSLHAGTSTASESEVATAPALAPPGLRGTAPDAHVEIFPGFSVSFEEAQRLLDAYRASYSPHCPFVPVPAPTTPRQMLDEQPFLLRVILQAVAPQDAATQRTSDAWLREQVARNLVVNQEKRLEMLQAIVVYLSWGDFHFYLESRATTMLQLAISLVIDLGLDKSPITPGHAPNKLLDEAKRIKGIRSRGPHTPEEMRAFLAVFYMASEVASLFRRQYPLPYTSYVAHCCAQLESRLEFDSDRFLVAVVRLQRLLCRIHAALPNPDVDRSGPCNFDVPLHLTMATIAAELEAVKADAPPDIQRNCLFEVTYLSVLMRLYEPAIYTRSSSASDNVVSGSRRTEILWRQLEATRQFFHAWMAIPLDMVSYLPFPVQGLLSYAIVTTTRLLSLSDADWSPQLVRKEFDAADLAARMSAFCDQADQAAASEQSRRKRKFFDGARSVMEMYRDKLLWISNWYTTWLLPAEELGSLSMMDLDSVILTPGDLDAGFWEAILGAGTGASV